jgi:hypothetical protein
MIPLLWKPKEPLDTLNQDFNHCSCVVSPFPGKPFLLFVTVIKKQPREYYYLKNTMGRESQWLSYQSY